MRQSAFDDAPATPSPALGVQIRGRARIVPRPRHLLARNGDARDAIPDAMPKVSATSRRLGCPCPRGRGPFRSRSRRDQAHGPRNVDRDPRGRPDGRWIHMNGTSRARNRAATPQMMGSGSASLGMCTDYPVVRQVADRGLEPEDAVLDVQTGTRVGAEVAPVTLERGLDSSDSLGVGHARTLHSAIRRGPRRSAPTRTRQPQTVAV